MPQFEELSKEAKAQFKVKDDKAPYAVYPFNQAGILKLANIDSDGVCRVLSLIFANQRFHNPPESYEETFGKHRTNMQEFAKRLNAMQTVASNKVFYLPSEPPVGASMVKLKTKRSQSIKLNSISDMIDEIVLHQAIYYLSMRTANDLNGHAIAFDTRGPMIMFDPNCGWWEVRNNPTAGGFFRTWFPKWYKEMGYKKDYHGGDRLLYRYT